MIRETIIRFNRDTAWLATGVVGTVIFAALVLAVQEHQPNAKPAEGDLSVKTNPVPMAGLIAKSSNPNAELTSTEASSVDRVLPRTSLDEMVSSSPNGSATPVSSLAFKPEANRHEHRQDIARVRRSNTSNERNRSSVAFDSTDVKRRLIELWHQSFAKNEKSRNWTAFSHLNKGVHKKAAYTAEMSH